MRGLTWYPIQVPVLHAGASFSQRDVSRDEIGERFVRETRMVFLPAGRCGWGESSGGGPQAPNFVEAVVALDAHRNRTAEELAVRRMRRSRYAAAHMSASSLLDLALLTAGLKVR